MNNIGLDEGMESEDEGDEAAETSNNKYETLPPFKELYPSSEIVRTMRTYGPNIVPLSMIGMMMNYTGNHLLSHIFNTLKKKIFYPMHKVTGI